MRPRRKSRNGTIPLTALLLLAAGVYLVVRSMAAANAVLSPSVGPRASSPASGPSLAEQAQARDEALRDLGRPPRDPFHPPERSAPTTSQGDAPARSPGPPEVRMILMDRVNPEVQLSLGATISGRMRTGQSFEGWTVTSITSNAVDVTKDGVTHTLTLRRQP